MTVIVVAHRLFLPPPTFTPTSPFLSPKLHPRPPPLLYQAAIDDLIVAGGMTVIVVAHRLSTIRTADVICLVRRTSLYKPKLVT
jgi:hypothetical protein